MEIIKFIFRDFLLGVRDSLKGFIVLWKLDNPAGKADVFDSGESVSSIPSQNQMQMTTLAARRLKNRDRSTTPGRKGETVDTKPTARRRVFYCCALNALCCLLLHYILFPSFDWFAACMVQQAGYLQIQYKTLGTFMVMWAQFMHILLRVFSMVLLFVAPRIVCAVWFQDIANVASRRLQSSSENIAAIDVSFSHSVADFLMAIVLETLFLLQTYLVSKLPIPFVEQFFTFVHWTLLYSLYSFEYVWMKQNIDLEQRLGLIEHRWPYFVGFGTLLSVFTQYPSSYVISGCLFGGLFPIFLISSFVAQPPGDFEEVGFPLLLFFPSTTFTNKLTVAICRRKQGKRILKKVAVK